MDKKNTFPERDLLKETRTPLGRCPSSKEEITVEVVEIYPSQDSKLPKNTSEKGSCHIRIEPFGMEIKNIPYQIKKTGMVWVGSPAIPRLIGKEKIFVPTVKFENPEIWKLVINKIREEILSLRQQETYQSR